MTVFISCSNVHIVMYNPPLIYTQGTEAAREVWESPCIPQYNVRPRDVLLLLPGVHVEFDSQTAHHAKVPSSCSAQPALNFVLRVRCTV